MTKHFVPLRYLIVVATVLLALCAGAAASPLPTASLQLLAGTAPNAPNAGPDDEIILLTSTGQVRIDDPFTPSGIRPVVWDSGSETGWTKVAAGDFNGDGDAEIVAAKNSALKVYDPIVQPGAQAASYALSLSIIQLLATGDFDGDDKDEIAITLYDSAAGLYGLRVYDSGAAGIVSDWIWWYSTYFGATWQDMGVGDFNNDGYDDLALVGNADRRVMVYAGGSSGLTTLATQSGYATNWLSAAGGNITATYAGDEIALESDSANAQTNALILLRVDGSSLVDIGGGVNYKYNPEFASLALGDLNGDREDEVVMLRDPMVNKVALLAVNPFGTTMRDFQQSIGYGTAAWKLVRTGDTDADGRDEIIVLRGDRYRIYGAPESNDSYTDTTGSFYVTSTTSNTPMMAVANVDGPGQLLCPTLIVSPTALTFDLEYSEPSTTQAVTISSSCTSLEIAWAAEVMSGATWLKVDKTSGLTPGTLGVSINTTAVDPGIYTGMIRISTATTGVYNTPQDVTVTLTLRGVELHVSPVSLSFEVAYGTISPEQAVSISSAGGGAVFDWEADVLEGADWLVSSATQGVTPSNLGVSVNAAAAGFGVHSGAIRIRALDPAVGGSPQFVNIDLTVPNHPVWLPLIVR